MPDAVIVDAIRTPIGRGRPGGALAALHPVDLLASTLRGLVDRTGVDPALIDDVIGGVVTQAGEQSHNLTRNAVLAAGFPETVPAVTVDRQCGSSQQAAHFAAQGVMAGAYDIVIACGVESMSRVPMGASLGGADPYGPSVAQRYSPGLIPQGVSAELIASKWSFDRESLDALALRSHRNAEQARSEGRFDQEIMSVSVVSEDGDTVPVDSDEGIRPDTTAEKLASLRPAFETPEWNERFGDLHWMVTAGNSSQVSAPEV